MDCSVEVAGVLCKRFKRPRRTFTRDFTHNAPLAPGDGVQEMVDFRDFCEVRYGTRAAKALEMWMMGGYTRAEAAEEGGLSPAGLSRVRERLREEWV